MLDPSVVVELARVKEEVKDLLPKLGKRKIKELKEVITEHYEYRYKRKSKVCKYGAINKGFTDAQLRLFFMMIDNEKYSLLFSYMAYVGLRIGEAVRVNVADINMQTRELKIKSEKSRKLDMLIIPSNLFQRTAEFIEKHKEEIGQSDGYLFYKQGERSPRPEGFLEPNYIRKLFREYIIRAGLDEVYDKSTEKDGRLERKLHVLTTHSLRHYAITHFANQVNGNLIMASKFARHASPDVTMTYIHTDKQELYRRMDEAFSASETR